jgi:N-carbamoylputrescine amidase
MRVTVCELNDEPSKFTHDWDILVNHVKKESSDLVVLPEMPFSPWFCATPKFNTKTWKQAVQTHKEWQKRLPELAPATVVGSNPIDKKDGRRNEGFIWTVKKGLKRAHEKRYLPNIKGYWEASWYQRGDGTFNAVDINNYRLGFMICSDLWAMEHARNYADQGIHILAIPRATEKSTRDKWLAGGKVAAVVSGAFCLSSNRIGRRGGATFGGFGWIVGPDAEMLGTTSRQQPFLTLEIDLSAAVRAKGTYPRSALKNN